MGLRRVALRPRPCASRCTRNAIRGTVDYRTRGSAETPPGCSRSRAAACDAASQNAAPPLLATIAPRYSRCSTHLQELVEAQHPPQEAPRALQLQGPPCRPPASPGTCIARRRRMHGKQNCQVTGARRSGTSHKYNEHASAHLSHAFRRFRHKAVR